jgi:hypothetical protein
VPDNEPEPVYRRDAVFGEQLRSLGVPFSDATAAREPDGSVFDAALIVPGDQALAAWLSLRNASPTTRLWPVIRGSAKEARFADGPEPLDPRGRVSEWWKRRLADPSFRLPLLTPDMIRADAAANIAEAERVSPTPWTFRSRQRNEWIPPPISVPDEPLPASEPNLVELFTNEGPFRCHRIAFGSTDWPIQPFMQIRLYPTMVPWEVFAYSPFGGWNDAPWPDEQLTMLRHWSGLYGAEIVSVQSDWYELFVPRPPRTRHQAIRLFNELTSFGEEQAFAMPEGGNPLEALGAAHYWHFWWD